jgi:acetylglutamate kinase
VARDVVFLEAVEINPVVVHGGGKRINKALAAAGVESRFVNGLRYTDAATVEVVDRVLSTEINPEIVDLINSLGGVAKGFAGTEIFTCKKHARDGEDYGFVGEVIGVNTAPLEECIAHGITPVISPTARDADGQVYNCNADLAAAQAAIALAAKRLVFMTDVRGLLRDPNDDATLISHLDIAEVDELKQAGIIATGMIPKVDSAVTAINAGVDKVALVNGQIHHAVLLEIFTDKGVGTEIVK